jgi:predicted RNase H-like HicB family nuclease
MSAARAEDRAPWRHDPSADSGAKTEGGRHDAALAFPFGIGMKAANRPDLFRRSLCLISRPRFLHFTLNQHRGIRPFIGGGGSGWRIASSTKSCCSWSKEDQAFIAKVPELPGCAADGATYQEALANAEVVIQAWIEAAHELGRPVPEPHGRLMYA